MSKKSILFALALAIFGQGAFAEESVRNNEQPAQVVPLTREQIQKGIVILLDQGIIEWEDGHFVLKDQNALDQLRQRGRVDLQAVVDHVICYKQQ